MSSWDIIIWTKENAYDLVPSVWGNTNKTLYKYPVGPGISEEVKNQIILKCQDITSSYQLFPASCRRGGITCFEKAQRLADQLAETSNIESEESDLDSESSASKKSFSHKSNKSSPKWKRPQVKAG